MCALFTASNFNLLPERQDLEAIQITSASDRDPRRFQKLKIHGLVWSAPDLRCDASLRMALGARHDERTALKEDKVPTRKRCPSFGRSFARVVR